uniref:Uncharacterized protein n=1 Tax=Pararge aegeria TaxID=116150 RepID=S4PH81_9NEOP
MVTRSRANLVVWLQFPTTWCWVFVVFLVIEYLKLLINYIREHKDRHTTATQCYVVWSVIVFENSPTTMI